jgi:polyhydroxyalkanoate synthase
MTIFSQVKESFTSALRAPLLYQEGLQRAQRAYFEVAPTPFEVIAHRGRARLLCYRSSESEANVSPVQTGAKNSPVIESNHNQFLDSRLRGNDGREAVFIIPSLIGRYYLFDLLSRKSFVSFFADQGFDVYLIDWGVPAPADREISFSRHISEYVSHFVSEACRSSQTPTVSLIGYSLGGVMAASFASIRPQKISSLTLLSTPIDFFLSGNVGRSIRAGRRAIDVMLSAFQEMPSWAIQSGFQWLTPASFWTDSARIMLGDDHSSKEELAALQRWLHDSVPIPQAAYREIVHSLYLKNDLLEGRFMVERRPVLLRDITAPTLVVVADDDHICPNLSSLALQGKTSGALTHIKIPGAHTAAAIGAAESLWPQLSDWMQEERAR